MSEEVLGAVRAPAGGFEDRDEDAEAQRAAEVVGDVDQAAGDAGVPRRYAGHAAAA